MLNSCETVRKYETDRGFVCRANSHVRAKSGAGMYAYLSLKKRLSPQQTGFMLKVCELVLTATVRNPSLRSEFNHQS